MIPKRIVTRASYYIKMMTGMSLVTRALPGFPAILSLNSLHSH